MLHRPLWPLFSLFKANVRSACAINLFQVLDKKIANDCYQRQYACSELEVRLCLYTIKQINE